MSATFVAQDQNQPKIIRVHLRLSVANNHANFGYW